MEGDHTEENASALGKQKKKIKKLKRRNRALQEQFDAQQDMLAMTTAHMHRVQNELRESKKMVEQAYRRVMDSVAYAQRLQQAMLPTAEQIADAFPEHFLMYRPKDIVSGDFYWFYRRDGACFVAAIDCTGHGVPGAMLTVLANALLNQIVVAQQIEDPALVLLQLDSMLSAYLNKDYVKGVKDGLDIAFCKYDTQTQLLLFAGAHSPLLHVRDGILTNYRGARYHIGTNDGTGEPPSNHRIHIQAGDGIYLFTDGYIDQFGGPEGKKLMLSSLRQLLKDSSHKQMQEQQYRLEQFFDQWRGAEKQIDDVLLIGIRF